MQLLCLEDVAAAMSVPIHRLYPLEPILHFEYRDRRGCLSPQKVNPNTPSLAEIAQIPLVEKALAKKIVIDQQQNGDYRNLDDFQRRLGINSKLTSQLMYYLQF